MRQNFILMILANGFFVFLYVFLNWAEYYGLQSDVNQFGNSLAVNTSFPWYIQYSGGGTLTNPGTFTWFDLNFTLWLFLLATVVNMYFIFRLQGNKETKQNPS
jgi:hypothetical protein